jgi:tetratricopeptide (TPR) repeat protein
MSQHLSKEELQSDALLSVYAQAVLYIREHRATFYTILGVLALTIVSGVGYVFYSISQESKAQAAMIQAEQFLTIGDWDKALNGDAASGSVGFATIASLYSGTDSGNMAAYYAAVSAMNLGNMEGALTYIRMHDAPDDVVGLGAVTLRAAIEANAGNNETAAEWYIKAAEMIESDTNTPQQLLLAAQHYLAADLKSDALDVIEQILNDYPDSAQAGEARKMRGFLTAE